MVGLGSFGTSWDSGSGCQFGLNYRRFWVKVGLCGFTVLVNSIV